MGRSEATYVEKRARDRADFVGVAGRNGNCVSQGQTLAPLVPSSINWSAISLLLLLPVH